MESLSAAGRRLIDRKILLVFCLGNFISFVDRINVSYAALEMNREIGLTPELFGFGAGLFFIAYAGLEIPSSYFLVRLGGPKWFARIMISWGICSAAMGLATGHVSFSVLRFIVGACEAGFAPGAYYYFARWYPASQLGRVYSRWILASIIASIVAGPLAAVLLNVNAFGLSGWRWMFFAEGIPAVALGLYILKFLPRDPASAQWLAPGDRRVLLQLAEVRDGHGVALRTFWTAFLSLRVWTYAVCFFVYLCFGFGYTLWLPQVVKSLFAGSSSVFISLMSTVPWLCAAAGTLLLGWSSDRLGDRRWHLAGAAFWAATFLLVGISTNGMATFIMLCLVGFSLNAFIAVFVSVPTAELKGVGAASGLSIINAVGGIGGFMGPYAFGALRQATGSFYDGMLFFGCMAIIAGLIPVVFKGAFPSFGAGREAGSVGAVAVGELDSP